MPATQARISLENNRILRKRKSTYFKRFGGNERVDWPDRVVQYNNSTPEQLQWVRKEVRRQKILEFAATALIVTGLLVFVYHVFF